MKLKYAPLAVVVIILCLAGAMSYIKQVDRPETLTTKDETAKEEVSLTTMAKWLVHYCDYNECNSK